MRFCDKLSKLRKENNLSQEQLADKVGVSRQAVSKWESGQSYPDMDKMIQMCKILNCKLDDLLDDGVLNDKVEKNSKFNFNSYLNDLLKFVTKTYNMFCSMCFKDKIKCLFELFIIFAVLSIIGVISSEILSSIIYNIFRLFPFGIENIITNIFETLYMAAFIVLSFIIAIHLFKIRYLDYFITVEDNSVREKTIEEPIDKSKNKKYYEEKREKIIIRDPKHTTLSFFDFLGKIILFCIKCFVVLFLIPIILCFVMFVFLTVLSIFHINYGIIFLFISITILGLLLINYIVIEFCYKFIFGNNQNLKRLFTMGIIGLIVCGVGFALTFINILNFEFIDNFDDLKYSTKTEYIEITENTIFHGYLYYDNVDFVIDNSLDKAKVDISYIDKIGYTLNNDNEYYYLSLNDMDIFSIYKLVLNDISNKVIRNYDYDDIIKIKIYLNQNDYDQLMENEDKFFD